MSLYADTSTIHLGFLSEISPAMLQPLNFKEQKISTEYKLIKTEIIWEADYFSEGVDVNKWQTSLNKL